MSAQWTFTLPANRAAVFRLRNLGGSKSAHDVELLVRGEVRHFFPVVAGKPELYRVPPAPAAAELTLRAFAEVPGMSQNLPLEIESRESVGETLLTLRGEEGRPIELSLTFVP
jgi:hypothetical protein